MGKSNNSNAVVDSQVRVFGVKGLRVVDASTFPFLPPRHPQSTVCYSWSQKLYCSLVEYKCDRGDALGEKIADDMLSGGRAVVV